MPEPLATDAEDAAAADRRRGVLVAAGGCLAAVAIALIAFSLSSGDRFVDPIRGLQQLDLLYLDEPAPALAELGVETGTPALIVICAACEPPDLTAPAVQVVVTQSPDIARRYGLLTESGRLGPGYAIIDRGGRVRYRTFDPELGEHGGEIAILLAGLR